MNDEYREAEVIPRDPTDLALSGDIDSKVATAKAYPRDVSTNKANVFKQIADDPDVALACWYSRPQGGTLIEGPSIRLAEIVATNWHNVAFQITVAERQGEFAVAVCEGWDMETNTAYSAKAKRKIFSSKMEEVTINAAKAIAYRDCVFKIVPSAYIQSAYQYAKQQVDVILADKAKLDATKKWIGAELNRYQVSADQLKATFGESIADMSASQLKGVLGILNALRSGYSWQKATGGRGLTHADSHVFSLKDMQ